MYEIRTGIPIPITEGFEPTGRSANQKSWPFSTMRTGEQARIPEQDWPAARNALNTFKSRNKGARFHVDIRDGIACVWCVAMPERPYLRGSTARRKWPFVTMELNEVVVFPIGEYTKAKATAYAVTRNKGYAFEHYTEDGQCVFKRRA